MIIVNVGKNMPIEKALKIYTSKIIKTKQMSKINKKKFFVKDSVLKRDVIKSAIHKEQKRKSED
jgi:ribosomal protein S21